MNQAGEARRSLWYSVRKLLLLSARISYNNLRRATLRRKIGSLVIAVIVLAVMAGIFAASLGFLSLVQSPQVARFIQPEELLANLPVWVLTAAFLGLILTSFSVLLQSLYLTGDMEFLLSKPVPIRAVFISKLIQAILPDFGFVCLFSLPVLFGLGISSHFSIAYYPLVLVVLMALALSVAALSSLLVMAVVRVVPARRVAELLGFIGALATFVCSQSGQLANTLSFSRGQYSGTLNALTRLNAPWSPLTWAGQGLMQVAHGQWTSGLAQLALFLGVTTGVFYLALVTAERLYYTGWSRVQVSARRKRPRPAASHPAHRSARPVPVPGADRPHPGPHPRGCRQGLPHPAARSAQHVTGDHPAAVWDTLCLYPGPDRGPHPGRRATRRDPGGDRPGKLIR